MIITYWVFGSRRHEEQGGMSDLIGIYEDEKDAQEFVTAWEESDDYMWAEYVKVIDGIPERYTLIRKGESK